MKFQFLIFCLILIFWSCQEENPGDDLVIDGDPDIEALGHSIQQFGWGIFKEISATEESGKNIVVSPLSIHTAISMAYNGARGDTKTAIEEALQYTPLDQPSVGASYHDIDQYFTGLSGNIEILNTNGAFWDPERLFILDKFEEDLGIYYSAELQKLDFDQPSSLDVVNDWVFDKTDQKIEKIIEQIKDKDVMFLINALYFKGDWNNPFPQGQTRDRAFTKSDGSIVQVPTMNHDHHFPFYYGDDYHAVDLPFSDSTLSMTFFVPDQQTDINDFISSYDFSSLDEFYGNLSVGRVLLYLPRFKVNYKIELKEVASALGMGIAFEKGKADFTGIGSSPKGPLYISRINHKAVLEIDEKGAEGSAVTAVVISADSLPPTIDMNRPFVFVIRDIQTNTVLFIGKVEDPEADE